MSNVFYGQIASTVNPGFSYTLDGTNFESSGTNEHSALNDGLFADDPDYLTTGVDSYISINHVNISNVADYGFDTLLYNSEDVLTSVKYHFIGDREGANSALPFGSGPGISIRINDDYVVQWIVPDCEVFPSYETDSHYSLDLYDLGYTIADLDDAVLRISNVPPSDGGCRVHNIYIEFETTVVSFGGASVGGKADVDTVVIDEIGSGGVVCSGAAKDNLYDSIEFDGGALGGGSAASGHIFEIGVGGGLLAGGLAPAKNFYSPNGGAVAGGQAILEFGYVGTGGAAAQGTAKIQFTDFIDGTGGAISGGQAIRVDMRLTPTYFSSGSISVEEGSSTSGISGINYNATGGVTLDNTLSPVIVNSRFNLDIDLFWRVRTIAVNDLTFLWSTGQLGVFFYRVVGKGRDGSECNLKADPCCQKFILNIHARTIEELCEKLSARKFIFPIESVQRFNRPASLGNIFNDTSIQQGLIDEYNDLNGDCDELVNVDICEVPACADFCVDFDLVVDFFFDITNIQTNGSFEYESGNEIEENRSLYLGGSALYSITKNLISLFYEGTGGISIQDRAIASPNHYAGRGGAISGGIASGSFSNWEYVGGEWPRATGQKDGLLSLTQNDLEGELHVSSVAWQLPERATSNDGLLTQADISFLKESEYLIVRNFKLELPADAYVFGLRVIVRLVATATGAQDVSVVLIKGDEIISDDLAMAIDWPLITTDRIYGSNGLSDGRTPFRDIESDPWDVNDLNDSDFGVAIRVNDVNNTGSSIVKIDSVKVGVVWEFEEKDTLRIGGDAKVVSSAWNYESSGGIEISGTINPVNLGLRFKPTGLGVGQTGIVMGGGYLNHIRYVADNGPIHILALRGSGAMIGGKALVKPEVFEEIGNYPQDTLVVAGGSADVITTFVPATSGGVVIGSFPFLSFGGVKSSGSAEVSIHSSILTIEGSGGVTAGGQGKIRPFIETGTGGMSASGGIRQPLTITGSADCRTNFHTHVPTGGAISGGAAEVKPFAELGNGGSLLGGKAFVQQHKKYSGSGGVELEGLTFVPELEFSYVASGGLEIGGDSLQRSSNWTWVSDGNGISIGGSSDFSPSDFATLLTTMKFSMDILQITASFPLDEDAEEVDVLAGTISQCGCLQLPLTIELGHNFARSNVFAQFLIRNDYAVEDVLFLRYNAINDSWQTNLHFEGVSPNTNAREKWDLVFELQCTNSMGSINIGRRIWKVAMEVFRKNLSTGEDFDTRVIVGIMPEELCDVNANELDFQINYNTIADFAEVNPSAIIYQNTIFDNIGLFKSSLWTLDPELIFTISQSGLIEDQIRADLTDSVFVE